MAAKVETLKVWRAGPDDAKVPPAFRALLPQVTRPWWVEAVLETNLASANGLRRVVLEELPNYALALAETARVETNDQHYAVNIDVNLRSLPLDIAAIDEQEAASLRFELAARNDTAAYVSLTAASLRMKGEGKKGGKGAAVQGLFNKTVVIGPPLQPGGHIAIDDIRVVSGVGRVTGNPAAASELDPVRSTLGHPGFSPACRVSLLPLDRDPNKESSLAVVARRHRLRFKLKAVGMAASPAAAAQRLLIRACGSLRERLRPDTLMAPRRLHIAEGVAVLELPGETDTIGQALAAAILEVAPAIEYVGAVSIPHEALVRVTVRHSEPEELPGIIREAINHAIATFDALERGFRNARAETLTAAPVDAGKRRPPPAAVFEDTSGAVAIPE